MNLPYQEGRSPKILKSTSVTPVFQKESSLEYNNYYGSISLTSNLTLSHQKLIHWWLHFFLEMKSVLYEQQYGFRNKHSTAHAVTEITEKSKAVFDKKLYAFGVFIDLQKTFDNVNHTIVINKLKYYRTRGVPNNLFKSFLTERCQFTNIDNQCSSKT